jgi:catechol 2,3-dioxygenase-like lactoylglutathione lyase family enzyme
MRLTVFFATVAPLLSQIAPPNATGVSMGHLHIVTPAPDAQKKLWIDTLGGKLVKAGPLEYAMFPGAFVGWRKGDASGGTDDSVVNHLGFLVRDLAGTRAKLVAAGVAIVRELPETHQFFAMFPDRVKVEFTENTNQDVPIRHHHIHFASHQVEQMRAWYAKLFGAIPGRRAKFEAADLPGVNLSWNPADAPTLPTKGRAMDHIGFEIRDLKEFCAKLEQAGVKLDMPPTARPDLGLTIAFLTDPWGTRVELTEGLTKF